MKFSYSEAINSHHPPATAAVSLIFRARLLCWCRPRNNHKLINRRFTMLKASLAIESSKKIHGYMELVPIYPAQQKEINNSNSTSSKE